MVIELKEGRKERRLALEDELVINEMAWQRTA